MADTDPNLETGDETGAGPDRGSRPRIPRWQKVVGIIGLVVILLVGIRMFGSGQGPGGHGPGHQPPGGDTPPVDFDHG